MGTRSSCKAFINRRTEAKTIIIIIIKNNSSGGNFEAVDANCKVETSGSGILSKG